MVLFRFIIPAIYRRLIGLFTSVLRSVPGQYVARHVSVLTTILSKCAIIVLITTALYISAVVVYLTLHVNLMPTVVHKIPLHLQFSPCKKTADRCTFATPVDEYRFPRVHVQLTDTYGYPLLEPGLRYTVTLVLNMPESEANKNAGMFMTKLNFTSTVQPEEPSREPLVLVVGASTRATILHHRSYVHHVLRVLVQSPFLLLGYWHEQQRVSVELFNAFMPDETFPVTAVDVRLENVLLEIYSAHLDIHAQLTGLRKFMYYYPISSIIVGSWFMFLLMSFTFLLLWMKAWDPASVGQKILITKKRNESIEDIDDVGKEKEEEQKRFEREEDVRRRETKSDKTQMYFCR